LSNVRPAAPAAPIFNICRRDIPLLCDFDISPPEKDSGYLFCDLANTLKAETPSR